MYLKNLFIENMGAIENLQLRERVLFNSDGLPKPIVLVGKNGSGKTTLMSSIVDAMYELANGAFEDVLPRQGHGHKYFKISGATNVRVNNSNAFSYIHFKENQTVYEYIDKNGELTFADCKQKTDDLLTLNQGWEDRKNFKKVTSTKSDKSFNKDFKHNSYCYFPSDRFELPYWINNETLSQSEQFVEHQQFSGKLDKDILIRRSLEEVKRWILDLFLDSRADIIFSDQGQASATLPLPQIQLLQKSIKNIEAILSKIIQKDISINLNFRGHGQSRIKLVDKSSGADFIPSLDNLSAGQSTLLTIFATIIKYSDESDINKSINLNEIQGIVLIDEIDLHLHIDLQCEVLPGLINLFPKVQFIVSSHSPYFLFGMTEHFKSDEFLMIKMPDGNLLERSDDFEEFENSYRIFQGLTNSYKDELDKLADELLLSKKPLIVTEGKTDWKHLKAALANLGGDYSEFDVDFLEYENEMQMGYSALKTMIESLKKVPHDRKIICIFDRDESRINKEFGEDEFNNHGNNVYSFCIPKIDDILDAISIEYYYKNEDLKTADEEERRLFEGTDFYPKSGNSECGGYQLQDKNKAGKMVIVDSTVFKSEDKEWNSSVALSKNDFADNILTQKTGFDSFDFDNFKLIFNILKKIIILSPDEETAAKIDHSS